jgi:hypothetical protein
MEYEKHTCDTLRDTNIASAWMFLAALFGVLMLAALI